MVGPRGSGKKYETPPKPWQQNRMQDEENLIEEFGLKNKKELWIEESKLREYRREARKLQAALGKETEQSEIAKKEKQQFLDKLKKFGLINQDQTLGDVLGLNTRAILDRRLQTQVYKKGYAKTIKQARQFIVHGHIAIDQEKVTTPSYKLKKQEENKIHYSQTSPLNEEPHPESPERATKEEK
ncbi:30S ribosomal protein S4 [archaeon SCG-AAA382B04]|nr:30S ribosomal protein S4 [archaeon SCG-AAA382B04]